MARHDKQLALRLRMQGKTYGEIRKVLGSISKSTLSLWLKDIVLSEEARRKIMERTKSKALVAILKASKQQTIDAATRACEIKRTAAQEIGVLSRRELLILGAALYWAEGHKRPIVRNGKEKSYHPISLTNSDPKLAKAFLNFMVEICGVDISTVKVNVRIFQHLNEIEVIDYWSQRLGVPRCNFQKTYLGISKSSMGKKPFNRLSYGVIQIRINNTNLFHKIMGWIEGLKLSQ